MSRGFTGGNMAGGSKSDLTKKKSMMAALSVSRNRNKSLNQQIAERSTHKVKSYKDMVEDLLDEKMTSTTRPSYFSLPGTVPEAEKEMSKGRKQAIEHFKMKRMKMRMKTRDQRVEVIPKFYMGAHGGRVSKDGRIMNSKGQIVMKINLNTGQITNRFGLKVGKYNPHSQTNDFKIQRLIDKYSHEFNNINPFANKAGHDFNPFGKPD